MYNCKCVYCRCILGGELERGIREAEIYRCWEGGGGGGRSSKRERGEEGRKMERAGGGGEGERRREREGKPALTQTRTLTSQSCPNKATETREG